MNIEIKNRFSGQIIIEGDYENKRDAVIKNRADLSGANLYGANLYGLLSIKGTKHLFCFFNNHIKIGCFFCHLEYWKLAYGIIGRENNYTEQQIREYHGYIKLAEQFKEIQQETQNDKNN